MATGRPSKKDRHRDDILRLYYEERKSMSQVSRELGIGLSTLSRWFKEEDWEIQERKGNPNAGRSPEEQARINARISDAQNAKVAAGEFKTREKTPVEDRNCESCGTTFSAKVTSVKRYCDNGCALRKSNREYGLSIREAYDSSPEECVCGKTKPYERRNNIHCSTECWRLNGKRRQKDLTKWITFTCQNESCRKEVSRLKVQSQHKYCSNECANKHTKTKKHIQVEDGSILDSKSEAFFWGLCGLKKINIERYDRANAVEWSPGNWYAPDFTISYKGTTVHVEVKGYEDPDDSTRWGTFRQLIGPLWILTDDDLRKLLGSTGLDSFLD